MNPNQLTQFAQAISNASKLDPTPISDNVDQCSTVLTANGDIFPGANAAIEMARSGAVLADHLMLRNNEATSSILQLNGILFAQMRSPTLTHCVLDGPSGHNFIPQATLIDREVHLKTQVINNSSFETSTTGFGFGFGPLHFGFNTADAEARNYKDLSSVYDGKDYAEMYYFCPSCGTTRHVPHSSRQHFKVFQSNADVVRVMILAGNSQNQ